MINIDFLNYLIEYAKTENLTMASRTLHISQSALTRAMQKVEEYIGVPIFERTKNKLTLNDTGKELVKNAEQVINAETSMRENTLAFYNKNTNISIGSIAPGAMIKYGNLIYSTFPNRTITSKIEAEDMLIENLKNGTYDFIFISRNIENEEIETKFLFEEKLYLSIPKTHFLSGMKDGVNYREIDGQSFFVADNLGVWGDIVSRNLPNSKFFPQSMDSLNEILNASTIPSFATNISYLIRAEADRIYIPITGNDTSINFYIAYKKKNKEKLKNLLKFLKNDK